MSIFLGVDFWRVSVFYSCWFDSGYMLRQFTEAFGVFLASWRWTRTLPVVVQRQVPVVPRYAALVVDYSGLSGFASSNAPRAVLAFLRCSLGCRQAQGFWLWWRLHRCSSWTRLWLIRRAR